MNSYNPFYSKRIQNFSQQQGGFNNDRMDQMDIYDARPNRFELQHKYQGNFIPPQERHDNFDMSSNFNGRNQGNFRRSMPVRPQGPGAMIDYDNGGQNQQMAGTWRSLADYDTQPGYQSPYNNPQNIQQSPNQQGRGGFRQNNKANQKRKFVDSQQKEMPQDGSPAKKKAKEYVVQMPGPINIPKAAKPNKKVNIDGQMKSVSTEEAITYSKCDVCKLFFSSEELLNEHKTTPRHLSSLKGELKSLLTAAKQVTSELQSLIEPSNDGVKKEHTCYLCDKIHHDVKSHKWTFMHQVNLAEGPAEKNKEVTDNDGDVTMEESKEDCELIGTKYIVSVSGKFCRLCNKKIASKADHCRSKKHITRVQKCNDYKERGLQKRLQKEKEKQADADVATAAAEDNDKADN